MSEGSNKKALKSGIWYTLANFITRGISFLTMPIFTRIMAKADVGDYANFTSWVSILVSVITIDLYTSVTLAKFDYQEKLDDYISSSLLLGTLATSGFYLVAFFFKDFLMKQLGFSELEFHALFLYALVYPAMQIFQIKNRLEYRYQLSVGLSLLSALLSTGVSLLCVMVLPDKLLGRIMGHYVPLFLLNLIIYVYFFRKSHKIDVSYWKYGLRISLPLIWHVLAGHLLASSDRVMIRNLCGSEDTALYSVAYSCSMVVSILWTSMNTAWSPWAFEQMNQQQYGALKKASRPYLLFFGFVVFCFMLAAPDLLWLMGGSPYMAALPVLPPVMVAFVVQFVYSLYVNIETFSKKQKYIAIGTSIAAAVNIILNYLLIPVFGYVAAAYTTLAGYLILLIIHYLFVRSMNKTGWYDTRFNLIYLLFFLILMPTVQVLYRYSAVRYALIGMLALGGIAVCVVLRRELIDMIRHRSMAALLKRVKTWRKRGTKA